MSGWLDVEDDAGVRRHPLTEGLTRLGGAGAQLTVPDVGGDQVHVWNDPPRAIFVGTGRPPRLNGAPLAEAALRPGDRLEWNGARFVYGGKPASEHEAELEELAGDEPSAAYVAAPVGRVLSLREERIWDRLVAGMFVELGLADRAAAKRWQGEVIAGGFDADACAREILARSGQAADDPRIEERSTRLLRDLLMAPLLKGAKGASRRARQAAQGGVAYIIANVIAFGVFALITLLGLLLLRIQEYDLNAFLDRLLGRS
ncbi:MAG: hypothetical protein WD226_00555 [Planctomycetota bacterium]